MLFVGTKKQAQETMKTEAERCGMYYVNNRWLGGMLTNFKTIRSRVARMIELEKMEEEGIFDVLPKKEVMILRGRIGEAAEEPERYSRYAGAAGFDLYCKIRAKRELLFRKRIF